MYIWNKEVAERSLVVNGESLWEFPDVKVDFGPIKTTTHMLGTHGWKLFMRQRTPLHVSKTRPHISLCPDGNRDFGFRWRMRARLPYQTPQDVFQDMSEFGKSVIKFSMTKFQIKYVPTQDKEMVAEIARLKDQVALLSQEKFEHYWQPKVFESEYLVMKDTVQELEQVIQDMREDPFTVLARWNEKKLAGMTFGPVKEHRDVYIDNVIDIVDRLQERASLELGTEVKQRLSDIMEA